MVNIRKSTESFLRLILCEIPSLVSARIKLNKKLEDLVQVGIPQGDPRSHLSIDVIRQYISFDIERLRAIEDKAKVTVAGITLALTVFLAGSSQISATVDGRNEVNYWLMGLVSLLSILAVLYLLIAGFCALKALRVKSIAVFSIDDEIAYCNYYEKIYRHLEVLDCNRLMITKYTNLVEVSYNAIRNGLICTAALVIVLAVTWKQPIMAPLPGEEKVNTQVIINNERSSESGRRQYR